MNQASATAVYGIPGVDPPPQWRAQFVLCSHQAKELVCILHIAHAKFSPKSVLCSVTNRGVVCQSDHENVLLPLSSCEVSQYVALDLVLLSDCHDGFIVCKEVMAAGQPS